MTISGGLYMLFILFNFTVYSIVGDDTVPQDCPKYLNSKFLLVLFTYS